MSKVNKYFRLAKETAIRGSLIRRHRLGAIGVRNDGAIVRANNLPHRLPEPNAHAEARVVRKLDFGSTVFVVRVLRDGSLTLARPCKTCQATMKFRGVKRCYYSINDTEYGVIKYA